MATELAKAYVQIIPSAQGIQGQISNVMNGESADAGESGGKSFASSFGSAAKKAIAGLGIAKIVSDGINSTSEFETAMAKTSTLFTGSAEEFDALKAQILDLSGSYGVAATTLAEAAYSAESASVPMEQLGPMLESSAKLATAGFTDIDTALSATAKTMNAYGEAAMSADDIQKVLIQTQNLGITTVGELGASLANVTPTAAAMGVGFDQVGAAMAQLTASGVQTAQATTQLRSAMTELGKSGTKADKAFREAAKGTKYANMGFKEAMAAGANLGDVFGMMQSYADKTGVSMVDLWGSVEAGNAAMIIASDVEKFNSNLEQMSTESDVVGEAYGKMANTFGNSMNRLKESAKNFMTTLFTGGDISEAFDNMLGSLGDVGERLTEWLTTGLRNLGESLPDMMESVLKFGDGLLDSLGNVDWIGLGVSILNGIIGALGTLGSHLIELVGSAVNSVVSGDVDFASLGGAILGGFGTVLESIGGIAQDIFDAFTSVLCPNGENAFANIFKDGETEINTIDWEKLGQNVASAGAGLVNLTGEVLAGGFTAAETIISKINWEALGETVGTVANGLIGLTGELLASAFTAAETLINKIDWIALGETVGQAANGLIDLSGEVLAGAFTAAEELINTIDWAGIGETVGQAANSLTDLTGDALAACFTTAETIINDINWAGIGETVAQAANGLIDLSGDTLAAGFTAAEALITTIDWEGVGNTVGQAANGLINLTGDTLAAGFTAAESLINTIDWAGLGETVGEVANKLVEYSGEALAAPFEVAFGILKGIKWDEVGSAIQSGLGDVWSGLTGFLGGLFGGAGELVQGFGSGVGATFEGVGKAIGKLFSGDDAKQAAKDLEQAMRDMNQALEEGKTNIETSAKNIGACIKNSIEENLTTAQMNAIGSTLISDIDAGTTITEGDLYTKLEGIGTNAAARFNAAGWSAVGRNIVSGIISGINESAYALTLRMVALAMEALNAVKRALGISSPSAVMRDAVGRWIPEGIAQGITENADLVENAMNELAADAAATNISGALAAQGSGFSIVADGGYVSSDEESLMGRIVAAIKEGMESADIALYMDGEKMSMRFDEYLGDALIAGRTL